MEVAEELNKKTSPRFLSCLILALMLFLMFLSNSVVVKTESNAVVFPDIQVSRIVEFENGGAFVINDTVTFLANASQNVISFELFQIGFPTVYKDNLVYYFAHGSEGRLLANLKNESWIEVKFPSLIDVSNGGSY
ncbi:MAG: hypothetical protein QXX08_05350, partial [Candidatus Bathyarchaeia archaeon]